MFTLSVRSLPLLVGGLCLAMALSVQCATASPQAPAWQVPLTEELLERFLASYPEVKALGKKYEKQGPKSNDSKGPLEALSGTLKHRQARSAIQAVLNEHGFPDFQSWKKVALSVFLAYRHAKSGQELPDIAAKTESLIARIRNDPRLTSERKQRMIAMLEKQQGMAEGFRPLPGNVALARKMLPDIAAVMDRK